MLQQILISIGRSYPIRHFLRTFSADRPLLHEFSQNGEVFTSSTELLKSFFSFDSSIAEEFVQVRTKFFDRLYRINIDDNMETSIELETAYLLYYLIRNQNPEMVVETGVSRGTSSFFILNAIESNGIGKLLSFDILPNAGYILNKGERTKWDFRLLQKKTAISSFEKDVNRLEKIDVFFHDSYHIYKHQLAEYNIAFKKIKNGYIISDDVNFSYAFLDFLKSNGLLGKFLITKTNVVGIVPITK